MHTHLNSPVFVILEGAERGRYVVKVRPGGGTEITARLTSSEYRLLLTLIDAKGLVDLVAQCGSRDAAFTTVYRARLALSGKDTRIGWHVISHCAETVYSLADGCRVEATPKFRNLAKISDDPLFKRVDRLLGNPAAHPNNSNECPQVALPPNPLIGNNRCHADAHLSLDVSDDRE